MALTIECPRTFFTLKNYKFSGTQKILLPLRKGSARVAKKDRRMIDIQRRNKTIRQRYYELLKQGHPVMLAYAMTGREFYLSEKRIRDIIAGRK